jgi:RHS repeat-associated protein
VVSELPCINYDANGNLMSVTDPRGYMTVFQYDAAGRLDGEYDPMGYAKTYTYDAAGNVASMTDESNRTTLYQYDELNRLVQATYPDNTTKTLSYTNRGKLATAANANLGYGFTYDTADRLTAVNRSDGRNIGYQYDAANRRTQMTTHDGRTFIYSYDTAGRLYQITLGASTFTFTYDTAGRRTGLAYPNGVSTTYTYNPASYLTGILARYNQQNTTDSFAYTHDNVGNRATMTDLVGEHDYIYDYTYQLISAGHPDTATETYTYDAAGNRLSASVDEENTPAGTATTYSYDYENRLIQVASPGTTAQYKYDPFGRRIEKSVNGAITSYLYDGPNIVTEYDGNGNVQAQYTHNLGVDDPLSVQQGASTYYYHKDGLGSVSALTSSAGSVVKRYKYRTFGEIYSESGTLVQPYTFTAREKDSETGLYYYRARYYDPKAGRFISKDSIGFAGGDANQYRYVNNNAVNSIDPLGLLTWYYGGSIAAYYWDRGNVTAGIGAIGYSGETGWFNGNYYTYGAEKAKTDCTYTYNTGGLGAGAGPVMGFFTGPLSGFLGETYNVTFDVGAFGVTYSENDSGWGLSVSYGGKGLGLGYYINTTNTMPIYSGRK